MGTDWIKRILVVGADTMGHSLAQTFAEGGYSVALVDLNRKTLDTAASLIASNLRTLEHLHLLEEGRGNEIMERIHFLASLEEGARDADVAIEVIFEDYEAKGELFERLETLCPSRTILASNTSYLNIFELKTLKRLIERGHLGVKSGRGFYDYSGKKMDQIMRERDIKLIKLKDFLEGI
jgi:3-hydroxybutyryl-CoA dehydrogenase